MRILLIHQAFCGTADPGGTRHYELAERLVAAGHCFCVVTSPYSYLTGQRKSQQSTIPGIEVQYAPTLPGLHRSYLRRVFVFLSFTITSVFVALRSEAPDVVVGTSPPIFQALAAWMIAALRRRPFLLEIRDLWPEFAINLGLLRNRWWISLARGVERFLNRRAHHIVVNSPGYRDYLLKRGISEAKITVIANGADVTRFNPDDRGDSFRREHRFDGKFVVLYAGATGFANNLDCLLQAAAELGDYREILFVIVGDGKELPHLRHETESLRLENLRFIPAQPKQRMPEVLAAADVCVAILRNIPMFRLTYPNKVFDYMSAGRPTIVAIDGAIREVIEASGGGKFVQPGDPCALAQAILELCNSPELRTRMGINARAYVSAHFNRDTQAREFAALLQDIVESRKGT